MFNVVVFMWKFVHFSTLCSSSSTIKRGKKKIGHGIWGMKIGRGLGMNEMNKYEIETSQQSTNV